MLFEEIGLADGYCAGHLSVQCPFNFKSLRRAYSTKKKVVLLVYRFIDISNMPFLIY